MIFIEDESKSHYSVNLFVQPDIQEIQSASVYSNMNGLS